MAACWRIRRAAMNNFIDMFMEFIEYLMELIEYLCVCAWEFMKYFTLIICLIISLPLWILPFVVWLIFVKPKKSEGGDER